MTEKHASTWPTLNKQIALALGYKVRRNVAGGIDITSADGSWYWGNCDNEEDAWRDALLELPNWADDTNAASELCMKIAKSGGGWTVQVSSTDYDWSPSSTPQWNAQLRTRKDNYPTGFEAVADSISSALALLALDALTTNPDLLKFRT